MSSCVVKGCKNGYRSIRDENIRLGRRQKCLFKTPKCAERRKKWRQALGLREDQLQLKHAVCEDHFNKSDVIKYDVTHLPDGTKVLLERGTRRLRPQAVPCNGTPVIRITKTFRISNIDWKEQDETPNGTQEKQSDVVIKSSEVTEPVKAKERSAQESAPIETGEHSELPSQPHEVTLPIKVEDCQKSAQIGTEYSFDRLVKDTRYSGRSGGWATAFHIDSVDFLNWDASNFRMTMVLRVHRDLTMKLFTADGHFIKSLDVVPKSHVEFLQILTSLRKTALCEGTGLKERRPEQCLGEVDLCKIEKRGRTWKRCQPCWDLRKKELEQQKDTKKDVQRCLRLTNKKNSRLKIKIDKLKEEVERAKIKCAGIQEKSLCERIESLPPPIQESVRTCLAAAKVKPRGRRYTSNWIHECMLIRMKSRKIYEHLRTHFILPLPCIDTLDRYIKKMNTPDTQDGISECLEDKLARIVATEKNGSLLLDDIELTERLDSDKSEVSRKLEEIQNNTELVKLP